MWRRFYHVRLQAFGYILIYFDNFWHIFSEWHFIFNWTCLLDLENFFKMFFLTNPVLDMACMAQATWTAAASMVRYASHGHLDVQWRHLKQTLLESIHSWWTWWTILCMASTILRIELDLFIYEFIIWELTSTMTSAISRNPNEQTMRWNSYYMRTPRNCWHQKAGDPPCLPGAEGGQAGAVANAGYGGYV